MKSPSLGAVSTQPCKACWADPSLSRWVALSDIPPWWPHEEASNNSTKFLIHLMDIKHVPTVASMVHAFTFLMYSFEIWDVKFINTLNISIHCGILESDPTAESKNCFAFVPNTYCLFISCLLLREDLSLFPLFFFFFCVCACVCVSSASWGNESIIYIFFLRSVLWLASREHRWSIPICPLWRALINSLLFISQLFSIFFLKSLEI